MFYILFIVTQTISKYGHYVTRLVTEKQFEITYIMLNIYKAKGTLFLKNPLFYFQKYLKSLKSFFKVFSNSDQIRRLISKQVNRGQHVGKVVTQTTNYLFNKHSIYLYKLYCTKVYLQIKIRSPSSDGTRVYSLCTAAA